MIIINYLKTILESKKIPAYMNILKELNFSDEELSEIEKDDSLLMVGKDIERNNKRDAIQKVRELIEEADNEWIKERRLVFIKEKTKKIDLLKRRMQKRNYPYWFRRTLWDLWKAEKWLKMESYFKKSKNNNDISDKDIELARNVDIGNIIEINERGFAICPAHIDSHPSLYCKNNFGYCFTCGWSGDCISLYMKINNVDFVKAVKDLKKG